MSVSCQHSTRICQPASTPARGLWSQAHSALTHGRWSEARKALEALAASDNRDLLPSLASYASACDVMPAYAELLQDRIDAVNSAAERGAL